MMIQLLIYLTSLLGTMILIKISELVCYKYRIENNISYISAFRADSMHF